MKKTNRVYGLIAVGAYMSNFNADLTGYPKMTAERHIFGSDKALKFPMKKMWQQQGDPVLYIRTLQLVEGKKSKSDDADEAAPGKLQPQDLAERYNTLFNTSIDDKTPSKEVLANLFQAVDVMNFGATFAEKKQNISITGAVQINQGFNRYEKANPLVQDILSPFRNSNEKSEGKMASTMGTKIVTDEAHYVYHFSVNPQNYRDYCRLLEGFEGYTAEAYEKFKLAARVATTAFNTNSKSGCENELALFIELKDESSLFLANLDRYVAVDKETDGEGQERVVYDLTKLADLLAPHGDEIAAVELYRNPVNVAVRPGSLAYEDKPLL
ncbi:MAG TPA: type I CRISPR-associated protein Cas7, partial [Clostridia bacterium]|nr:type I CRISPR-associated protein Cas7 [Clostridia bacterium]